MDLNEIIARLPTETDQTVVDDLLGFCKGLTDQVEAANDKYNTLRGEYVNRFMQSSKPDPEPKPEPEDKKLTFESLFKMEV